MHDTKPIFTIFEQLDRPAGEAPRKLDFSVRAMMEWRRATKQAPGGLSLECLESLDGLAVLIWAMARQSDPHVTVGQLRPFVDLDVAFRVGEQFRELAAKPGDSGRACAAAMMAEHGAN